MLASVTISDWAAVLLVLFTVPSGITAINAIVDRRQRNEKAEEKRTQRELIEMIGHAFFGPDPDRWPRPGQPGQPRPASETLERVAEQLTPSNGKTVAKQIEETNREIARVAVLVGEHMSDGHGGQVWPISGG